MSEVNTLSLSIDPPACGTEFVDAARMEFQASLQLLAERAAYLTASDGCAIALEDDGALRYCASSGSSEREPGTKVSPSDLANRCLTVGQHIATADDKGFTLHVPVLHDGSYGFVELTSQFEFSEEAMASAERIADLVAVASRLRDAAENAQRLLTEAKAPEPEKPAPAGGTAGSKQQTLTEKASSFTEVHWDIHACAACGFPISPTRELCVDCERNPETSVTRPPVLSLEEEATWLGKHGYTIATILVTLLTAAVVLWLRR